MSISPGNCTGVVDTNGDITGIGVTVAFLAQVAICAGALLPIRFLRVYKPKMSEDILQFMEPVLTGATDVLALTCNAHIITAMYTFDKLSFDQVRHILTLHWPAALLFLVSTGVLWEKLQHPYVRLLMQTFCIAFVFAISIRTTLSQRLHDQMHCVKLLLRETNESESNFESMFKATILTFPVLTLAFWFWTLVACYIARRDKELVPPSPIAVIVFDLYSKPFSKMRRFLNVYADIALICVPASIVLVSVNLTNTNKRLAMFKKNNSDNDWTFGQIFSLLMVAGSLFEVYKGFMEYVHWKNEKHITYEQEEETGKVEKVGLVVAEPKGAQQEPPV
ncbi:hypothetical protein K440DRAFT_639181 [Wilcoxina mikolae CBS 423.85]|nr:hypothetical protein K440DRAFT_639181 [Wilcoxina mikolae CBS 423.85]